MPPTLPLQGHTAPKKHIVTIADNVHVFVDYALSVCSVVIGTDGYILIDTGGSEDHAVEILQEISRITPLPLAAVILTHSHFDHTGGLGAFLEGRPVETPVWGRANFGAEQAGFTGLEAVSGKRAGRQFGANLPPEEMRPNQMVPYNFTLGKKPARPPLPNTFLTENKATLTIAGLNLELHAMPGETVDTLCVRLPDSGVVFTGDTAYRAFPNLYPIRGSAYRDVPQWAASVRAVLALQPTAIVMGHNDPALGAESTELLTDYSDAIQYVYDETVRGMNAGLTPDQLAETIQLPAHLQSKPYLAELYGYLPWAVRSIYSGLLGWFDGNPSHLFPLTQHEEARRMAILAGGQAHLLIAASSALIAEDWRWAAQLADYCIVLFTQTIAEHSSGRHIELAKAKKIKADALYALSSETLPMPGYNYLRSCALELRAEAELKKS